MKRSWLKRKTGLRKKGKSDVSLAKDRIQCIMRQTAIKRDSGCILRHYEEAGECGGYRNDGELILQGEHLVTRERNISFGDMRNIVLLCKRHHFFFKKQHSSLYWDLIRRHIGEERWAWFERVKNDRRTYTFTLYDWNKIELALSYELSKML